MIDDTLHILYLAHDLNDTSVHKRVRMLKDGGATLRVMGFYRGDDYPETIYDCPVTPLGQTFDGQFLHRILVTLKSIITIKQHKQAFEQADCIIARTLEMLAIAVRGRSLCIPNFPTLIYESLDIHRLLLKTNIIGKIMRGLEGWLSTDVALLITSSPAFISEYFEKISKVKCPTLLIENKVYEPRPTYTPSPPKPSRAPWKIGWFGAIRCHKSLSILKNLVTEMDGIVEVIIRGKPSLDQFDDFYAETADTKGISFLGGYKPEDLQSIYNEVHFTWAIDMFEEGLNSSWLLPNRIYEGGRYGSVPLAQSSVETGRAITRIGTGFTLDDPLQDTVIEFFRTLTPEQYTIARQKALDIPLSNWVDRKEDCIELVEKLSQVHKGNKHA